MNQLAEALARVSGALKMSHTMIARCPWYKFRTRWHLKGAHDMLEAMYQLLYQLTLEAATMKKREENHEHGSN